jgi:hypothetical protein
MSTWRPRTREAFFVGEEETMDECELVEGESDREHVEAVVAHGTDPVLPRDSAPSFESDERPRFKLFRELGELPAEPEWLWRGYLSPGSLTLLAGHPFKGKSMLVGGLLRALAQGEPFLGRETTNATALLVTEEDDSVLRQRAELLGLLDLEGAYISRSSGVTRYPWPELVAAAADRAVLDGHSLLVFDTFPGLAQLGDEQENDAGAINERLRPLLTASSLGLAVLFLHHMNGYGQPRGSKAFRGIVDIQICLHRGAGTNFWLETESRYPTATPPRLDGTLVQAAPQWYYETAGPKAHTRSRPRADETDDLLWDALVAAGDVGLTYGEIRAMPGLSDHKAKRRFPDWYANDRIRREGNGARNGRYRWFALPA